MYPQQSPFGFGQQAPFGGTGGMTSNQIPQPMQSQYGQQVMPLMQQMIPSQNPMMQQAGMPYGMQQGGMPQAQGQHCPAPQAGVQAQGIDPQYAAALRSMQQAQQQPNLRALLGM